MIQSGDCEISIKLARITKCLTTNHQECTGKYTDTLSGNFILICNCECHFAKKNVKQNKKGD